ncbi:hypothetical protein DNTS_001302 [Danionella cerebrum]|uniref:DH domain-containing protein n=1 Tax=Danionella cerebrum TaxID=2873325 RepID=A0A553Q3N8_9TELE|nr:hypothetical protein DNTS_001302 [Danionella translucida]
MRGGSGAQILSPAMNIIGAEDEDFENDEQPMVDDQSSHFNSIELLKSKPTHLLVFIHHVMLQFDCAPVLCYLHADLMKNLNAKDTKKHFGEFYNTFLEKGAILKVCVPSNLTSELDRMRPELISEEQQKRYANEIQFAQSQQILQQLDDFRQKRMMGMTPNEHELNDVESHRPTDRIPMDMKEKAVAENLLERMVEAKHFTKQYEGRRRKRPRRTERDRLGHIQEQVSVDYIGHTSDLEPHMKAILLSSGSQQMEVAMRLKVPRWKETASPWLSSRGDDGKGDEAGFKFEASRKRDSLQLFLTRTKAVAYYMKYLGVKTRSFDNKKSKSGWRPSVPSMLKQPWTGGKQTAKTVKAPGLSYDGKQSRLDFEVKQPKQPAAPHRVSIGDAGSTPVRKFPVPSSGSTLVPESTEEVTISVSVTPSPDVQGETGVNNNRSEPKPASEVGDVSPVSPGGALSISEPLSIIDVPPEDCVEGGRKKPRNVRRSESLCVERRHSRRGGSSRAKQSRSRSDVDLQSTSTSHPLSPSPQHSVSVEGDKTPEVPLVAPTFGPFPQQEEVEPRLLELEQDPLNWRELAPGENLQHLSKREAKRQEVINELFVTEHAHVRMLSVLQTVFSRPLERLEYMTSNEVATIFSSLDDIIEMHCESL